MNKTDLRAILIIRLKFIFLLAGWSIYLLLLYMCRSNQEERFYRLPPIYRKYRAINNCLCKSSRGLSKLWPEIILWV